MVRGKEKELSLCRSGFMPEVKNCIPVEESELLKVSQ